MDSEHKAISDAITRAGVEEDQVRRFHATTVRDLADLLCAAPYELVQFSGHGKSGRFLLEGENGEGYELTAERLLALLQATDHQPATLLLMCCYSAESRHILAEAAKTMVTLSGDADDEACITFVNHFYALYLRDGDSPIAAAIASEVLHDQLHVIVSRRVEIHAEELNAFRVQDKHGRGLFCDIRPIEGQIGRLGDRERFLTILGRKLRLHRPLFSIEREAAVIPIGKYLGVFSWSGPDDVMVCHAVRQWRPDLTMHQVESFSGLLVRYNDTTVSPYRVATVPVPAGVNQKLAQGIDDLRELYAAVKTGGLCDPIRDIDPEAFAVASGVLNAAIDRAETLLAKARYPQTISQLELGLSSTHDLVDALLEGLTDLVVNSDDS